MDSRGSFGSKLGVVLASAGSAVGLGNIWRFPTEVGRNGGAAFILIYLLCVVLLAMPVMVSEFVIGRASKTNTVHSYRVLAPGKPWVLTGFMGVLAGVLVLSFYSVVAGWTLNYTVESLTGQLMHSRDFAAHFSKFSAHPLRPLLYVYLFLLLTHFVVSRGVRNGIERYSKLMMPLLFIILLLLVAVSITMPGSSTGLTFLLRPDFSKITVSTVLEAMGQAFYSLSVAMGCICTYASYFSKDVKLVNTAFKVAGIDTMIAIMSGVIIFPAVFSVGITPDAGPSLVFIALPNVFQQAFGNIPAMGYIVSVLFYGLLVLATLTSVISLQEVVTAYLSEEFSLSRAKAAGIVTMVCVFVGSLCALSMGPLKDFTIGGRNLFDFFDFFSGQIMLPIGGFLIALFVGWFMRRRVIWEQLTNQSSIPGRGIRTIIVLLKFFVPFLILLIFLSGIGFFQLFS